MEDGAGKGLECQKIMDGKASNGNDLEKEIPSCCLKAKASAPEVEAKCHSTVVSGWFSASQTCSGHYLLFIFCILQYIDLIEGLKKFTIIHCFLPLCLFYYREIWESCLFQQPNVARWVLLMHLHHVCIILPCDHWCEFFLIFNNQNCKPLEK